jgi:hypothetical protein
MKERGLLCTASVALALHEGRQTQDRRPMKAQPPKGLEKMFPYPKIHGNICLWCAEKDVDFPCWKYHSVCPVQVGDIFYVKETWTGTWCYESMHIVYAADGTERTMEIPEVPADYALPKVCLKPGNWASPFFMPPWASRTRKRVTGIRVERGPEISEEDAIAEGFEPIKFSEKDVADIQISDSAPHIKEMARMLGAGIILARGEFMRFWHDKYGDDKPWRWVYDLDNVSK